MGMEFHMSSHHDAGTPGAAVFVVMRNLGALHAGLHQRGYPFSIRTPAQLRGTADKCSSSTLLPTGFASTSPHRAANSFAPGERAP
jgi:hypothetical protein